MCRARVSSNCRCTPACALLLNHPITVNHCFLLPLQVRGGGAGARCRRGRGGHSSDTFCYTHISSNVHYAYSYLSIYRCVAEVLEHVAGEGAEVMVATHNQASIESAVALMGQLGIESSKNGVFFGQLLGMADHLTFTLGRNGYRVSVVCRKALTQKKVLDIDFPIHGTQEQTPRLLVSSTTCRESTDAYQYVCCWRMQSPMHRLSITCHERVSDADCVLCSAQGYKYVPFGPVELVMPYLIRRYGN